MSSEIHSPQSNPYSQGMSLAVGSAVSSCGGFKLFLFLRLYLGVCEKQTQIQLFSF